MELLAHRGFWKSEVQKNTNDANKDAFKNGWGIETDIRDYMEELVICHDVAKDKNYTLGTLLNEYNSFSSSATLALNIKADGLSIKILELLTTYKIQKYFVFDMSIPETLRYIKLNMDVFISYSEMCTPGNFLYEKCKGIWLDIFNSIWFDKNFVISHILNGKQIAFVSPELHGRDEMELWSIIKENNWHQSSQIMLCTDYPDRAKTYFNI
jgi:glycerophosphoryl diester phosphodiesterase